MEGEGEGGRELGTWRIKKKYDSRLLIIRTANMFHSCCTCIMDCSGFTKGEHNV